MTAKLRLLRVQSNTLEEHWKQHLNNIVGLRFVSDSKAGIIRKRLRDKHHYFDIDGKRVTDVQEIQRIKALAIPPAWTDVWICPLKNGHIQATGRDAKLRKQYRYHTLWRETRDAAKFEHMVAFGKALPVIRQGVATALALPGLPQDKVLATIIYLLQLTLIRIGNDEYAKQNQSYGLTTLRNKHLQIKGAELKFHFKGKSGVEHSITVADKKLASVIQRIRDLPGQDLFQYVDDNGLRHAVSSSEVNDYLRLLTGENYTAKDFRTWYGTLEAAKELMRFEAFTSATAAKQNVGEAIKAVAKKLGNTPTICRKCYVHPAVINTYLEGTLTPMLSKHIENKTAESAKLIDASEKQALMLGLSIEELAVLEFLQALNA